MATDQDSDKKLELKERIRQRVACEERAYRIVEKLVEKTITETYLCDIAAFIDQANYDDIVEERSIAKLCGYPICSNALSKVLKQKYHISTKTNTIYDITRRKRFCSAQCFKASEYYAKQVLTSPVWSRGMEKPPVIKLLPRETNMKGGCGDNVIENPKQEIGKIITQLNKVDSETAESHSGNKDENDIDCGPYSARSSKAKGPPFHVHRADYYGYDTKQQQLKASVCSEIENKAISGFSASTASGNKGEINSSDKKYKAMVQPLSINIPDYSREDSQQVNSEHLEKSDSSVTHSKTDMLMDLLDKREDLKKKLNRIEKCNQKENSSQSAKQMTSSQSQQEEKAKKSPNVVNYKSVNELLGTTSQRPERAKVLENIERASQSRATVVRKQIDSDDDCDSDDDDPAKNNESPTRVRKYEDKKDTSKEEKMAPLLLLRKVLFQWRTIRTVKYLTGKKSSSEVSIGPQGEHKALSDKVNTQIRQHSYLLDVNETSVPKEMHEFTEKVQAFYNAGKSPKSPNNPKKTPPNVQDLIEETENLAIKEKPKKKKLFDHEQVEIGEYDRSEFITEKEVMLPYVDSKSQEAIRIKIVLDKATVALEPLLGHMELTIKDISQHLKELINTFHLTSENIILQPSEWTLVAFFILKLLSKRLKIVKMALRKDKAEFYVGTMLHCLGITAQHVQTFMTDYMNM